MVGAPVRRRQVAYVQGRGLSIRRACALMSVARSTLRYESRLVKRDAPVVAVMRELAAQYPRYGYRRIQVFLGRRGHVMSADRTHRLWRLHGLQVPRKRPRRRVAAHRPRPLAPTGANQVWAYDFLFDACANGQQLKCLTVIDEYTRECLAIDVAGSIRSARVIEVLSKLVSVHGAPKYLRSDNVLRTEASFFSGNAHPVRDRQGCRAPCSRTSGRYPAIFRDQEIPADHSPHKVR
jgi:putative transposase